MIDNYAFLWLKPYLWNSKKEKTKHSFQEKKIYIWFSRKYFLSQFTIRRKEGNLENTENRNNDISKFSRG